MTRAARWVLAVLLAAATLSVRPAAHDPITTKVTWNREVRVIVERRCAGCHRPDGPAPMPLLTYRQARPWAHAMSEQVTAGRMPRWLPARSYGHFENDRGISPFEVALLRAWAAGGAPAGESLQISEPDAADDGLPGVSVVVPARADVPDGKWRTHQVTLPPEVAGRSIVGWHFVANDRAVVQAEFRFADGTYLGSWSPPDGVSRFPSGVGVAMPASRSLSVDVLFRGAQMQVDFPVGLPVEPGTLTLLTQAGPTRLRRDVADVECGEQRLDEPGAIFAVRPVAGEPGSSVGVAVRPGSGRPVPLIWARDFDPAFRPTYRLRDPVSVEPGSHLVVEGSKPNCRVQLELMRPHPAGSSSTGAAVFRRADAPGRSEDRPLHPRPAAPP